eukprot:11726110-Alexandrium_andersonii.AAC.1
MCIRDSTIVLDSDALEAAELSRLCGVELVLLAPPLRADVVGGTAVHHDAHALNAADDLGLRIEG